MQFRIFDDPGYAGMRRRGLISLERDLAASPRHMKKAIASAQQKMIANLARMGYEYVDDGFEIRGPLPHLEISGDASPDPGELHRPDPRNVKAWLELEQLEKARTAKAVERGADLVDYELVASFKRKKQPGWTTYLR